MARSEKKDPKLSEVKAVLQRLQGFTTEPEVIDPQAGAEARFAAGRTGIVAGAIIFIMAACFFGVALFIGFQGRPDSAPDRGPLRTAEQAAGTEPSSPGGQPVTRTAASPAQDAPAGVSALEAARALMIKGQVRAAREQLLALAAGGSPHADIAWAIARSYDPNVLVEVAAADAAPDIKEATRWYRAWYAAAVRQGMVADSVSLERIIGSMRQ
ncbi:MAG TPA: hypothetical protein VG758_34750 [Hyphomicrobiaceae bacterium]|jgi:hypothetical protein|nr:hypothetical protein [Hyphomicrobiaceae bacterium]